jgi:hypothetical protein
LISREEGYLLQELAKEYSQTASLAIHSQRMMRMKRINDCIPDRPVVLIDEIPWHEMNVDGELDLHCTPPFVSDLPAKDYQGGPVRARDTWIRGTAQMFSAVSPAMHQEFEISYMKSLFERCGLVYYGCCEPLHDRINLLKDISTVSYCPENLFIWNRIVQETISEYYS